MSEVFIISDTHFGHSATFEVFKDKNNEPLRPFKSLDEMHETFITNWNSVVGDGDLVLHLGDVAFSGQAYDEIMPQLKGSKYLIRGNHDRFSEGRYRRYFNRILGVYIRDNYAFTHVPIHPDSGSRWIGNIHGHLHANKVMKKEYEPFWESGKGEYCGIAGEYPDPFYFNASCEQINYTPINFNTIRTNYYKEKLNEQT